MNPEAEDILVANQITWRTPSDTGAQIHPVSQRLQRSSFYVLESDDAQAKHCCLRLFGLLDEPVCGEILLEGRRVTGLDSEELGEIRNRKQVLRFQPRDAHRIRSAIGDAKNNHDGGRALPSCSISEPPSGGPARYR